MLTESIAEHIVRETMRRLNRNINIMDREGRIIASGDPGRVGERHAGGLESIRSGRSVVIGKDDLARWPGARPGINMPIVFRGQAVGAIGITGEPEEIAEFAQLVRMATELMLEEADLASRREERNRIKESLLKELAAPAPDSRKIAGILQLLQVEALLPGRAFMIGAEEGGGIHALLMAEIEQLLGAGRTLAAMYDHHRICVLCFGWRESRGNPAVRMLQEMLVRAGLAPRIGCSAEAAEISDLPAIMREAAFALAFAGADRPLAEYAGLEPRMLIEQSDPAAKRRFAERVLGGIPDGIIDTLRMFLACNQDVRETADALYVHKNTVIYRLNKIKERTGYDPRNFQDAVLLQTALWSRGN